MKLGTPSRFLFAAVAALGLGACDAMKPTDTDKHAGMNMPAAKPAIAIKPANVHLTHRFSFTSSAKDSVGTVEGKLVGGAKVADGKLTLTNGTALSGDATVQYLDFGAALLPKSGSASIAFWYMGSAAEQFARVIDLGDQENGEGRAFLYYTPRTQGGQARAAMTATTTADRIFVDSTPIDDGKVHSVIIVIDGTAAKLHVYVDGKEAATAADLAANTLDKIRPVHNWIGRSGFDANAGLTGSIDEFRVYDSALTAAEATIINAAGPDVVPPG